MNEKYLKYDLLGTKLIRTKTLGDGDEVCNFHVVPKGKSISYKC